MKYKEQKDKGLEYISLYVKRENKARWKQFANEHNISLTVFLTQAAEFYINNAENPPKIVKSQPSFSSEEKSLILKAIEKIPVLEAKLSSGLTFQTMMNVELKEQMLNIFQSHTNQGRGTVIKMETIQNIFPSIEAEEIYNILNELVRENKLEKTSTGWRSL